jgi:2-iminoacetate synthase
MDLAKPGQIHKLCRPNAILTFAEYLADCAGDVLKVNGQKLIAQYLDQIAEPALREETKLRLARITAGERDIYF